MVKTEATDVRFWERQEDAVLNQANPISGDQYAVGAFADPQENVRIYSIQVVVTWTVQPTPLQVHIAIDGIVYYYNIANPVSGTNYYAASAPYALNEVLSAIYDNTARKAFLIEGKSIEITAETTGGTVQNITCRVKWARYI